MNIYLKTITNKTMPFKVHPTDTLKMLQQQLEEREGLPPQFARMIYNGKRMDDPEKTMEDYGLKEDAVVHIMAGGGK